MKILIRLFGSFSLLLLISCTSGNKRAVDQYREQFVKITAKLASEGKISLDSANLLTGQYAKLTDDSSKLIFITKIEELSKVPSIPKLTIGEYYNYFFNKFNSLKIEKLFEQAPLYGKYANSLASLLEEMDEANRQSKIFSDTRIKNLYETIETKDKAALGNYLKYGEPDEDLIYINSACKTALRTILKDPKYEVVKDNYYLKQTSEGYDYKLLIRAKNSFGANVLQEITFSLVYDPINKSYEVVKSQ
jgi:hypothetical protein